MRVRRDRPALGVAPGERLLAWATTDDGEVVGGTRDAFYLPGRVPWEEVEAADWDRDTSVLQVREVGSWGEVRSEHTFTIPEPGRLLQLVRERVTASVVLQRHVPVRGRRGVRVIGRRPPGRPAEPAWFFEYDEGVDPTDPDVKRVCADALAAAQQEVGGA
ncbi:MAG: hypothetical protein WKF79_16440 [Nocardioides sp.]